MSRRAKQLLGVALAAAIVGALGGAAWRRQQVAEAQARAQAEAARLKKQQQARFSCTFSCGNQFQECRTHESTPECANFDLKERACVEACLADAAR